MSKMTHVETLIMAARIKLVCQFPFFGLLALRLEIKNGSGWIPTAATDGKFLYYNEDFFNSMTRKEAEWVIGHEVLHCVYQHLNCANGRDKTTLNKAQDYVINADLRDARFGNIPRSIQVLLDKRFDGMTSDQIYLILIEEQKKEQPKGGSGGSGGSGESGESGGSGGLGSFDVHMDENGDFTDANGNKIKPDESGMNGPVPMTAEERERLTNDINHAIIQAAKTEMSNNAAGFVPRHVRRLIKSMTEPKVNWRDYIHQRIQSAYKCDFTFSRPNRKSQGCGFILPGMRPGDRLDVDIAVDTSGSISHEMLADFLGEIKGIMTQYHEFTLRLWTFDTNVYNVVKFDNYDIDELDDYEVVGGGGTSFEANWDYMREHSINPNVFIVMTDGHPCGSWGEEGYCETIFLIHGSTTIEAPFGTTLYYDNVPA